MRILPFLLFIHLILISSLGTSAANDRPFWLLTSDEIPKGWTFSSEIVINNFRYYISFLNSEGEAGFSIETIRFSNASDAQNYVIDEYTKWNQTDQLIYVFPKDKVDLSLVDTGVNWEVKSACCYSRGVLFSIDHIYIYIFGSQEATWSEINLLYNIQLIKILNFLNRDIPSNLLEPSKNESNSVNGWMVILGVSSLMIAVYIFRQKY
ncbi:MAG: hypothetical protein ACFFAE_12305 [Candidatus Hodarchaeota archaeon]